MLDNKTIYKRTLVFSVRRLLWDIFALIIMGALMGGGYLLAEKLRDKGLIGLAAGGVIGLIVLILLLRFVSYRYKAGQIAMMTRGITEDSLPDDVLGEGKREVKERFATVAAFFALTGIIKGIFSQIGSAITKAGEAIGGDAGGTVGSAVSTVIQTVVRYLCDCCLGWVFFRKGVSAVKATCEGAVLFFKHGKTFAKNMGRVFGIGLATLIPIGGVFGGAAYLVMNRFPQAFAELSAEIGRAIESGKDIPQFLTDPKTLMLVSAAIVGLIFWSMIHSIFIRPFVLVGVLRNYLESGIHDIPTEDSFSMLDSRSPKFRKLREKEGLGMS